MRTLPIPLLLAVATLSAIGCNPDSDPDTDTGTDLTPTDEPLVLEAPTLTTDSYVTADQMILANEINESGEPWAEALGYDLDLLDPAVPDSPDATAYVLGIENYEYSRYQLGTVISRSGLGLHMMWAPMIQQMAAMEGADFDGSLTGGTPNGTLEDDELTKNVMTFASQSGHTPPGNPWPQFAEFASGDPRLPQAVDPATFAWEDFSSLRWDRSQMDKTLNPAALGQTLMKQYLWASDMLSAYHDGNDEGIDPTASITPDQPGSPEFDDTNDVFLGGDSLDGFVGQVLTAEAINKVAFLKNMLAYDGTTLGSVDPATYDPSTGLAYFPHAVAVTEGAAGNGLPPMATGFTVTDGSSHLFDQVSLLWGTSSFADMANPAVDDDAHLVYAHVFDGSPFPAPMSVTGEPGPYDLFRGTSKVIFQNLMAMHFDPDAHVFVDVAGVSGGAVTREDTVNAVSSAYLIVSLETFVGEFAGTPLEPMAVQAVRDQAAFLVDHLSDGAGNFVDATTISATEPTGVATLEAQAAAVRGLFVAARITGDASLRTEAQTAYTQLIATYHMPEFDIFLTQPDQDTCTFTPRNVALLSGALREAALEGSNTEATAMYVGFFRVVGEAMQIAEGGNTGESGGDSDNDGIPFIPEQPDSLPPVFATQAVYQLPTD